MSRGLSLSNRNDRSYLNRTILIRGRDLHRLASLSDNDISVRINRNSFFVIGIPIDQRGVEPTSNVRGVVCLIHAKRAELQLLADFHAGFARLDWVLGGLE